MIILYFSLCHISGSSSYKISWIYAWYRLSSVISLLYILIALKILLILKCVIFHLPPPYYLKLTEMPHSLRQSGADEFSKFYLTVLYREYYNLFHEAAAPLGLRTYQENTHLPKCVIVTTKPDFDFHWHFISLKSMAINFHFLWYFSLTFRYIR